MAALLGVLLLVSHAQAQAGPRVMLLAPEASREAWTSSLRIELAPDGGEVVDGEPPAGDSAGERVTDALARGGEAEVDAVVWLEPGRRDLLHVHVAATESRRTLAAPLATAPDGRTVALVAVSLLDEALAVPETSVALESATALPSASLASPLAVRAAQASDDELPPDHRPVPAASWVQVYAGLGTGGLAFVSDSTFDPGTLVRLVLGMRLGAVMRLQANVEGGGFSDPVGINGGGLEIQPFGRLCPEFAGAIPLGAGFSFWIGGHGCVGITEIREPFFDGGSVPGSEPFFESFDEGLAGTLAGGGFLVLDIPVTESLGLWVRGDVDGSVTFVRFRQPAVLTSVTTTLVFQ